MASRSSPRGLVFGNLDDWPSIPESFWEVELRRFVLEPCDAVAIDSIQRPEDLSRFDGVLDQEASPIGRVEILSRRLGRQYCVTCCLFSVEQLGASLMDAGVGSWGATIDAPPSELLFFSESELVLSTTPGEHVVVLHDPRLPSVRQMLNALPSGGFTLVELGDLESDVRIWSP